MKARWFTAFVLAVGLALLVPSGGQLLTAQSQPGKTYRVTAYYQLYPPGDGQALLGVQDGTSAMQWVGDGWTGVWRPLSQEITVASDRLTITLQGRNALTPIPTSTSMT